MGKRKERRIAALASGRRYKLDLFADPSGDLSGQEGASDNLNNSGETGVPGSPTSGKENPLTLLSQYTEEDSDEEEMERSSDVTREGSVPNSQIAETTPESSKAGSNIQKIAHSTSILQEITPGTSISQEMAPSTSEDLKDHSGNVENISKEVEAIGTEPIASEDLITRSSLGESVMHTGSDVGGDWKAVMHAETNQCYYWNTVTGETSWEVPAELVSTVPNEVDAVDNSTIINSGRESSELVEPVTLPLECQMSGVEDTDLPAKNYVAAAIEEEKGVNDGTAFAEDFDPDKLVKYGEDLLDRLKLLNGPSTLIKIIREIEIRISDCKELKPYGMSLFPFWLHAQSKLRCLEASIYNAEASLSKFTPEKIEAKRETTDALGSLDHSSQITINGGEEIKIEMEKQKEEKEMVGGQEEKEQEIEVREEETILPIEDVDMEIEEETMMMDVTNTNTDLPLTSLEEGEVPPPPSPLPHDWAPPPPPSEDEPVPPPPLDVPIPPPPPEESSVSYSVIGTVPPYQDYMAAPTYNYSAASGSYTQPHYYDPYYTASAQVAAPFSGAVGQAVPVTNGMVEPTVYNYAVPTGQGAAELSTKPQGTISLYHTGYVGMTNEIAVSSAGQAVGSVYVTGDSSVVRSSAVASSVAASPAATPSVIVSPIADYSAAATSAAASSADAATSSAASSADAATSSAAPPVVSKDQPKVSKSKKRSIAVAPTLRSNKKVASLVNKWNAAKEERDNDDEPKSAYEALERKRQKAIEEWRLHQIASGEAENNANFVPLGGDWRERVKRKRAKKAKMDRSPESSDATTAVTTDIKNENQDKNKLTLDNSQLVFLQAGRHIGMNHPSRCTTEML